MRCKHCKIKFTPRFFCQKYCMDELKCIKAFNDELKEKKINEKVKSFKENLKKLSEYEAEARKEFQAFIRLRDKNENCISCNCSTAVQWDGGHYLKAELFSGLIFNEDNCFKQCSRCNDIFSGNELEYRDGLIKRKGLQFVLNLESIKNSSRVYKYTKEELIEIKEKYKKKIKNFKT